MVSVWDELYELPKETLVIELVKARRDLENLCIIMRDMADTKGVGYVCADGNKPSDEWLDRIAKYAESRLDQNDHLSSLGLMEYGIDEKTAEDYCYPEENN